MTWTSEPVIGVTAHRAQARFGFWDRDTDIIATNYVDAVLAAGAQAVLLPARAGFSAQVVSRLDGLILSGGPDVDPGLYGEERHARTEQPAPDRDVAEMTALTAAYDLGIPILAVCRGAQLLNVWRGGTLDQHFPENDEHDEHGSGGVFASHPIDVVPGSWLDFAVGRSTTASCHHHQSIKELGEGLVSTAASVDGVVEGVELGGGAPIIGIQWHPEETADDPVIPAFVDSVRLFMAGRS